MAGDFVPEEELNLKGIQKYFNSYTLRGRFNWVVATYGSIFGFILLYKLVKMARAPKQSSSYSSSKSQASSSTPSSSGTPDPSTSKPPTGPCRRKT